MLNQPIESFNTHNQVKGFLQETLKDLMAVFKAECGSLFMFDEQKKELVLESFHNSKPIPIQNIKFKVGEGVCGKVMQDKTAVLVKDIDQDSRFNKNGFGHYHTNSFMALPLISPDGVLGLINIADKADGQPFSEKDLEFAKALTEYACIIAYNLNLAQRLKSEKEALDKQKALLEKYASVGKLAAGVVHEINNPLDGIIRFTNMLLHQIDKDSVAKEYLLEIKKGLNRIEGITKSLLQFSHQVNNPVLKVKSSVDLHQLIDESLSVFSEKIKNNKITILRLYINRAPRILDIGLAHIFINIIKNAIDAMPSGGTLEIATQLLDNAAQISFKDTGVGIPTENIEHIFDAFYTTKSIDKGTGLGLSICKEIIGRYGGKIEVKSTLQQGSVFIVTLPKKHLENV